MPKVKRCKVCSKKPRLEKRVNNEGVVFCSDDCYEEYEDSPNDFDHPYIDDYEAIRFEYIEWMKDYENQLYSYWLNGQPKKGELEETIDEIIDDYYDYYRLEGSDGVFSEEIYHYLLAFKELQKIIKGWEPNERELSKRRRRQMAEMKALEYDE